MAAMTSILGGQVFTGVLMLIFLNVLPFIYARLLHKKRAELGKYENKAKFGALFEGLDLDDE